jgi:hypothetical protein
MEILPRLGYYVLFVLIGLHSGLPLGQSGDFDQVSEATGTQFSIAALPATFHLCRLVSLSSVEIMKL